MSTFHLHVRHVFRCPKSRPPFLSHYAVSLIKAGARLTGKDGGDVRPPLVMLTKEDSQSLQTLIDKAAEFVR